MSEADAEVQVLSEEGKVEITRQGEKGTITIAVDPGKHRLKVKKNGFELFTDNFEIESGTKTSITAKLVQLEDKSKLAGVKKPSAIEVPKSGVNDDGWKALFDGQTLTDWTGDVGLMTVENGVLVNDGKRGIVTAPGDYQNVEIEVEFRLANGGNSGLGICYAGSGDPSKDGLEIQMLDDDGNPGVKDIQRCGSIYMLAAAKPGHFKRWPEWNRFRVTSSENDVRVELNGVLVTNATRPAMKQTNPQHAGVSRTSGKLCLFPHTGRSEYRNFRIRPAGLKSPAGNSSPPVSASPFEALQGTWIALREEVGGSPANWVTEKRFVFADRKMIMTRKSSGTFGKYEGTFKVEAPSGSFDFTGTDPGGKPVEFRGIYKIDGDSLTLCYKYVKDNGTTRPTEFKTDDKAGTFFVLVELRRDSATVGTQNSKPVKSPPADAAVFEGHAYKFLSDVLTWHQAKSRCEELGGHLAIVTSDAENKFVLELAKKGIPQLKEFDGAWLGATDEQNEGDWRWIDGKPMGFNVWAPGQPNNKENNEHYLLFWLPQGVWADQPAKSVQHTAYFVCEWDSKP